MLQALSCNPQNGRADTAVWLSTMSAHWPSILTQHEVRCVVVVWAEQPPEPSMHLDPNVAHEWVRFTVDR
jgi:hypothetical protein